MQINTKADLEKFIATAEPGTDVQTRILADMKLVLASIKGRHGRSTEARDAVVIAKALHADYDNARPDTSKAPKKKSEKTKRASKPVGEKKVKSVRPTLSDEEKAERKATRTAASKEKAKARAVKLYGTESVNGKFLCLCGCGVETESIELKDETIRHKLFIQGHDAKLKGKVKMVARELLPRRVLTVNSTAWIERWRLITNEERSACGIQSLPKSWEDMTDHGKCPKSWEEFADLK